MNRKNNDKFLHFFQANAPDFTKHAKVEYNLTKELDVFDKYAGLKVKGNSIDEIEDFITEFIGNELPETQDLIGVNTTIKSTNVDISTFEGGLDCTGEIELDVKGRIIGIPFVILEGELLPFDVLELNGRRVPYNRENLFKVVTFIEKEKTTDESSGIEGLADDVNPSSSAGFIGETLNIRNEVSGGQFAGPHYVYASEFAGGFMEKAAELKPLTKDAVKEIEKVAFKKEMDTVKKEYDSYFNIEKTASENTESILNFKEKVEELNLIHVSLIPDGSFIKYMAKEDDNVHIVNGVVLDLGTKKEEGIGDVGGRKLVLADDGRYKVVAPSDPFVAYISSSQPALRKQSLKGLKKGDKIAIVEGKKVHEPSVVHRVRKVYLKDDDPGADDDTERNRLAPYVYVLSLECGSYDTTPIFLIEDTKVSEMSADDIIKRLSKSSGLDENTIATSIKRNYYYNDEFYKVADPNTACFLLTTEITDYPKGKEDYLRLDNYGTEKIASNSTITISQVGRNGDEVYDVLVEYADSGKTFSMKKRKEMKNLSNPEVRALLRVLSFNRMQVDEMMSASRGSGFKRYALPMDADVDRLVGVKAQNNAFAKTKDMVRKSTVPDKMIGALATATAVGLTAHALNDSNAFQKIDPFVNSVKSKIPFMKAASAEFEKVASENMNESALNTAKVLYASSEYLEKVASTVEGKVLYPKIDELSGYIMDNKAHLEKMAYDLTAFNYKQACEKHYVVPQQVVREAVDSLDFLHKVAYAIDISMNK